MNAVHCLQRLIWIIWSPSRTFQALRENPSWLGAFLVIGLGTAITTWLTVPGFQKLSMLALPPSLTAAQLQRVVHLNEFAQYVSTVAAPVLTLVMWFISALLIWLIVQIFEGLPAFKTIFAVVAYANVISLLSGILITGLILVKLQGHISDPQDLEIRLGLDLFFEQEIHPALRVVLANLNPFNLWYYGLLIMGAATVCGFSFARAAGAIGSFWTLTLAFSAGGAWVLSSLTVATPM